MFRALHVAAATLLACLGLVLTVSSPASADCTCKQGQLQQLVERADVVFIGSVDNVETAGNDQTYDITASRSYQGMPEPTARVGGFTPAGRTAR